MSRNTNLIVAQPFMMNLNASQRMCMTSYTATGKLNYHNRKPYRSVELKKLAKKACGVEKDGAFRVPLTPVLRHADPAARPSKED